MIGCPSALNSAADIKASNKDALIGSLAEERTNQRLREEFPDTASPKCDLRIILNEGPKVGYECEFVVQAEIVNSPMSQHLIIQFPTSSGKSGRCERTSKRTSEWSSSYV